jgi:RNA polymerase sigma-70 factor (ECF subfamily)
MSQPYSTPQPDNTPSTSMLSVDTLQRFCVGDSAAFDLVYQAFDRRLYAFLKSRFGLSHQDTQDTLQNLWLEILRRRKQFNPADGHSGFSGWVHKIARDRSIDQLRRCGRDATVTDPDQLTQHIAQTQSPEVGLQRATELQQFGDCLQQLPPELRRLILGKYIHEKSTAELAEQEDIPQNTVSSRLRRGKQQLQKCIDQKQNPEPSVRSPES